MRQVFLAVGRREVGRVSAPQVARGGEIATKIVELAHVGRIERFLWFLKEAVRDPGDMESHVVPLRNRKELVEIGGDL